MIIDADIHVTLDNMDTLRPYLPERYRGRRKFLNQDEFDRDLGGNLGKDHVTAAQHLVDMDIEGIDVQVLYPTGLLNFGSKREAEVAVAMARAYNDWLYEFCQTDPRRFKGVALVGLQDMPEAVREMTRAVTDLGMVGVFVPSYVYPGKDLGSHDFDDLYAEAERLGIPIGVHRVAGTGTIGFDRFTRFPAMHALVPMFEEAAAVANMVFGGVFERYPTLRVAFLEAGVHWLPWLVEKLDEHAEMFASQLPHLKALPSEYLRSGRAFFSFEPGEDGVGEVAELLGEQALVFSSDYPHFDSPFPNSVRLVRERTDLSDALKERILTENPARCYRLPAALPA
jgi:predicted TIM-barrel fold metal-dependent hydrolase